jgi:DNA-binding NarL/FixJ family response regulator
MEDWTAIRAFHAHGFSICAIGRELGIARNTVRAALARAARPRYQCTARPNRRLFEAMQRQDGAGIARGELVDLAEHAPRGVGLTVRIDPTSELVNPLVVTRVTEPGPDPARFEVLTAREHDVARLVTKGVRNRDIADALGITLGTVKDRVHRILAKTGLPGRAAIVAA